MLETLGHSVQILGVPLALIGLWLSARSSAKSQDLQVILNFVESFREKWEGGWADLLDRVEAIPDHAEDRYGNAQNRKEMTYVLNWIDWVGNLARSGFLRKEDVILQSINHALSRALKAGEPIIEEGCRTHGENYWAGLHFVKQRLKLQ